MLLAESLEDLRIQLADKRKKRKFFFEDMNTESKFDCVDNKLRYLKSQELSSDNLFFRLAIIDYELGDLTRSIVYSERFIKEAMFRDGMLAEGKLAMADVLTQLYLLCISLGWNFGELRKIGAKHLEERQKDFKRDGWKEVK